MNGGSPAQATRIPLTQPTAVAKARPMRMPSSGLTPLFTVSVPTIEPASAASIAGLFNWSQKFRERSQIVCTVTGHGLKDPDSIKNKIGSLEPVPAKIDNVRRAIGF